MQKKILAALFALLLAALPALGEAAAIAGNGYTVTLPEGLSVLPKETVQGYFAGAAADVQAAVDADEAPEYNLDAILVAATEDGKTSVNIIAAPSDGETAQEAAEAARAELTELIEGLSATEVDSVTHGEREFAHIGYAVYGNDVQQYFLVAGETLFCLTCTNMAADDAAALLASFQPQE